MSTILHMPAQPTVARPSAPVSDPASATRNATRRRLALRSTRMESAHPEVHDLETRVLNAGGERLRGSMTALAGVVSPSWFRDLWNGFRPLPLGELCRLALHPSKEAREAVSAVLAELAGPVGLRLVPDGPLSAPPTMARATADFIAAAAEVGGTHVLASAGQPVQQDRRLRELAQCERAIHRLRLAA